MVINNMDKQKYQEALKIKLYFDLKDARKENGIPLSEIAEIIIEAFDLAEVGALTKMLNIYVQKSVEPEGMPEILNPSYVD